MRRRCYLVQCRPLAWRHALKRLSNWPPMAPADAARLYGEIADVLRERFPGYADRIERLRATALRAAGDYQASHDLLMQLAIRDLWETG